MEKKHFLSKLTNAIGLEVVEAQNQYAPRRFDSRWPPGLGLNPKNTWSAVGLAQGRA